MARLQRKNSNAIRRWPAYRWLLGLVIVGLIVWNIADDFAEEDPRPPTFDELVHQLEIESLRGTEYFNSPTYDSLVAMGDTIASKLTARIKEPNRQYLLTLLALREVSPDSYRDVRTSLKTGILVDALNQATYFNAWGIPHGYWTEIDSTTLTYIVPDTTRLEASVEAIIELDSLAIDPLRTLLTKNRSAPYWSSGEGFAGEDASQYRVADYALALIRRIEGKDFPATEAKRDSLIKQYLEQPVNSDSTTVENQRQSRINN